MGRILIFIYGVASYVVFLASFLYAIGFVKNMIVPTPIDGEATVSFGMALIINMALLSLFAV